MSVVAWAHHLRARGMVHDEAMEEGGENEIEDGAGDIEDDDCADRGEFPDETKERKELNPKRTLFANVFRHSHCDLDVKPSAIDDSLCDRTIFYNFDLGYDKAVITKVYSKPRGKNKYNVECKYSEGAVDHRLELSLYPDPLPKSSAAIDELPVSSWLLLKVPAPAAASGPWKSRK
jgi:hypothetical protein